MHCRVRYLLNFDLKIRSGQVCQAKVALLDLILSMYQLGLVPINVLEKNELTHKTFILLYIFRLLRSQEVKCKFLRFCSEKKIEMLLTLKNVRHPAVLKVHKPGQSFQLSQANGGSSRKFQPCIHIKSVNLQFNTWFAGPMGQMNRRQSI